MRLSNPVQHRLVIHQRDLARSAPRHRVIGDGLRRRRGAYGDWATTTRPPPRVSRALMYVGYTLFAVAPSTGRS
jgi:hypothetical protein